MGRGLDGTETMSSLRAGDSRSLSRAYKVLVEVRVEERCTDVRQLLCTLEAEIAAGRWQTQGADRANSM